MTTNISALHGALPAPPPAPRAPSLASNLFKLFKATFDASPISSYAVTGAMVGYFTGQSYQFGVVGATAGALIGIVPLAFDQLPEDVKELARGTADMGAWALGTYALYNLLPSGISRIVPNISTRLSALTTSVAAMNPAARTFGAVFQPAASTALKLTNEVLLPYAKTGLSAIGFGNHKQFAVSALGSYLSLKSLEQLGKHPSVKPLADVVKGLATDKTKFADKLISVALAIYAIPVASYLISSPSYEGPSSIIHWASKGITVLFNTANTQDILNAAVSKGFSFASLLPPRDIYLVRAGIVAMLFVAHIGYNLAKPVPSKKVEKEEKEITAEDIYELLLSVQGDVKGLAIPKDSLNRLEKLKQSLKPLQDKLLKTQLQGGNEHLVPGIRDEILKAINTEIQALTVLLGNARSDSIKGVLYNQISDVLGIKFEELRLKQNVLVAYLSAETLEMITGKQVILATLNARKNAQTALQAIVENKRNNIILLGGGAPPAAVQKKIAALTNLRDSMDAPIATLTATITQIENANANVLIP